MEINICEMQDKLAPETATFDRLYSSIVGCTVLPYSLVVYTLTTRFYNMSHPQKNCLTFNMFSLMTLVAYYNVTHLQGRAPLCSMLDAGVTRSVGNAFALQFTYQARR